MPSGEKSTAVRRTGVPDLAAQLVPRVEVLQQDRLRPVGSAQQEQASVRRVAHLGRLRAQDRVARRFAGARVEQVDRAVRADHRELAAVRPERHRDRARHAGAAGREYGEVQFLHVAAQVEHVDRAVRATDDQARRVRREARGADVEQPPRLVAVRLRDEQAAVVGEPEDPRTVGAPAGVDERSAGEPAARRELVRVVHAQHEVPVRAAGEPARPARVGRDDGDAFRVRLEGAQQRALGRLRARVGRRRVVEPHATEVVPHHDARPVGREGRGGDRRGPVAEPVHPRVLRPPPRGARSAPSTASGARCRPASTTLRAAGTASGARAARGRRARRSCARCGRRRRWRCARPARRRRRRRLAARRRSRGGAVPRRSSRATRPPRPPPRTRRARGVLHAKQSSAPSGRSKARGGDGSPKSPQRTRCKCAPAAAYTKCPCGSTTRSRTQSFSPACETILPCGV